MRDPLFTFLYLCKTIFHLDNYSPLGYTKNVLVENTAIYKSILITIVVENFKNYGSINYIIAIVELA